MESLALWKEKMSRQFCSVVVCLGQDGKRCFKIMSLSKKECVYCTSIGKSSNIAEVPLLSPNSPGFGGTTSVPLSQRLPTFLEIVPALLAHLKIKHIHIAAQSAGTLFALNLLALNPGLLSPSHPSITLFSPWVHQSHTGISVLLAASKLPDFMLNHWASLTGFMINSLMPSFATSSGALASFSSWFGSSTVGTSPNNASKEATKAWEEQRCVEVFGVSVAVKVELDKLVMKYAFGEECSGGNDEARLCLKSLSDVSWGALESYPAYITSLSEVWKERVDDGSPKLTFRVLLAEEDAMIGEKGAKYLQEVWTKEACGTGVDIEFITLDGTDHDSVLDPVRGAVVELYKAVKDGRQAFVKEGGNAATQDVIVIGD